jgi:hypothetical protein
MSLNFDMVGLQKEIVHPENENSFKYSFLFGLTVLSCLWDLFFDSKAPGLVISRGYACGMPTPSLFPSTSLGARGSPIHNTLK